MSGTAVDRRTRRRESTRQEILDAAWELARENGLAGLTMRDLGARVGMRAQSLYSYFSSKHAIYDAMFAQGNREILDRYRAMDAENGGPREPHDRLRRMLDVYLRFCAEDPVRHQLLHQRTIPGFEPGGESYRVAVEVLGTARAALDACGITSPRGLDMWTALTAGLAAQQNANEPGGTRWLRLADDATEMFLHHFRTELGGRP
jgi:AcrR family transcriptional regulator